MDAPLNGDDDTLRRETKEIVDAWRRVPRDGAVFLDVKQPALINWHASMDIFEWRFSGESYCGANPVNTSHFDTAS